MISVISASLNVVNIAVLFLAETRRRAMVRRIRDIFSDLISRENDVVCIVGFMASSLLGSVGSGVLSGRGAETVWASAFVILPSFPLPFTDAGSIFFSSRIFCAAGDGCPVA